MSGSPYRRYSAFPLDFVFTVPRCKDLQQDHDQFLDELSRFINEFMVREFAQDSYNDIKQAILAYGPDVPESAQLFWIWLFNILRKNADGELNTFARELLSKTHVMTSVHETKSLLDLWSMIHAASDSAVPTVHSVVPTVDSAASDSAVPTVDSVVPTVNAVSDSTVPTVDSASSDSTVPTVDSASSDSAVPTVVDDAVSDSAVPTVDSAVPTVAASDSAVQTIDSAVPTVAASDSAVPTVVDAVSDSTMPTVDSAVPTVTASDFAVLTNDSVLSMVAASDSATVDSATDEPKRVSVFNMPLPISDALCAFLGQPKGMLVSRISATKSIIEYAKSKGLIQGKDIKQDEALRKLFPLHAGSAPFTILTLQSHLKAHFLKVASDSALPTVHTGLRNACQSNMHVWVLMFHALRLCGSKMILAGILALLDLSLMFLKMLVVFLKMFGGSNSSDASDEFDASDDANVSTDLDSSVPLIRRQTMIDDESPQFDIQTLMQQYVQIRVSHIVMAFGAFTAYAFMVAVLLNRH